MNFTLTVQNFRGLRNVKWSPSGVCAVVGPNGSGKTTLIDVLDLLRDASLSSFSAALTAHGGAFGLRCFTAPKDEPVTFGLGVQRATWTLQPEVTFLPGGARLPLREKLMVGEETSFESQTRPDAAQSQSDSARSQDFLMLPRALERDSDEIIQLLAGYRHHRHYALSSLRREGSELGGDRRLEGDGANLFTVLMNWNNRREDKPGLDFITRVLRKCFPDVFMDFSFPIAANIVSCEVHTPGNHTLVPSLLPDGFLVALIHLCAVVSTWRGGVIAIDEPENALHPFAIRRLMDAIREWSDDHDLTVLMATHSPVILDTFKEMPEKVFVMEPGHDVLPVSLDKLKGRDWLAHFSLGDLYEHLEYGAPAKAEED